MSFGKNRVQFEERFWSYLRFKRYDVYYYKEGKALAVYTSRYADKEIQEIEKRLDYNLENKIQFLVFNKYSDLKQSNIGLMNNDLYNTGGITHIVGTKVFLYFDGDHRKLEEQIRYGIADIILNELLYGQSYFSMIKNSTLINFPEWYLTGLHNYISKDWNAEIDDKVKDGILSGRYKKFNRLEGEDAINAGHSIWKYIADKYGEAMIPNVVYMSKINKNVENGFLFVLGVSFKTLAKEWYDYYYDYMYSPQLTVTNQPTKDNIPKKIKKSRIYRQFRMSHDGRYATYSTNELGQYKIWLYNINSKKTRWIYKREHRLDEKTDYSFPLLAWHPSGKILSFVIEAKGKTWLYFYSLEDRKLEKRPIYLFDKILDYSYNDKGDKFVVSAVQKGHSDIFIYNIPSNTFEPITRDICDDLHPRFINNSKDIIFSSNRINDTLKNETREELDDMKLIAPTHDIFIYHLAKKGNVLERITNTADADETMPDAFDRQHVTYLSDANGNLNLYLAKLDSAVNFVDTIVHYRSFVTTVPVTNNLYNILEYHTNPGLGKYTEIINYGSYDRMYVKDLLKADEYAKLNIKLNNYKPKLVKKPVEPERYIENSQPVQTYTPPPAATDTSQTYVPKTRHKGFAGVYIDEKPKQDTNKIDINNYKFSQPGKDNKTITIDTARTRNGKSLAAAKPLGLLIPRARNANVEYNISQLVSQLDFSYLNTSYQPFSGGGSPIFINPGFTAFFKLGVTDLFEDYRIVGGVRLSLNFTNNEYFLSFNNMKKRLDRELILHRQTFENTFNDSVIREHTNEALYILKYPLSEVAAVKFTATLRDDKFVYMSVDNNSLKKPNKDNIWGALKAEYVFDNTREKGINLYYGTRYKLFAEYFRILNDNGSNKDLFVLGFDYRHYIKISRTFIWANRFAISTSLGRNKLIYYFGGVDTWLNPSFDQTISISRSQNYVYQTLATPMRGFDQNIRNGNSFALINSELRFPVFKYFVKRPIKSDFLNTFQVVGFTDIGTAWTGPDPYSDKNSLYTQEFSSKYVKVKINNQKEPIVEGFGFGLRSRVFGYFVRADWAWGVEDREVLKRKFYLSLSLDF